MKMFKSALPFLAASMLLCACAQGQSASPQQAAPEPPSITEPAGSGEPVAIVEGTPVLFFFDDDAVAKLRSDAANGSYPVECNVLFDQMGELPEVTVTDTASIREIYDRFSQMIVLEESSMSITDNYHHVAFTLADGTRVSFGFEGTGLLSRDGNNYAVSDEGNLWGFVRELQENAMAGRG